MSKEFTGALIGALLAFAGLRYGFGGFVLFAVLMAAGATIGHLVQSSDLSVGNMLDSVRKNSSSR
ncbi:hypothetical protein ACN082_00540 [Rothia sp. CCM 9417]|uniref:hypothetical protein n=1 Tax=unclassified Rothia (in: high G+C Gram-positive bacteria) TaxID=2689056 RepID=UPI003AED1663